MIKAFITVNDRLETIHNLTEKGSWINLINPSDTELYYVSTQTGIDMDLLKTALDEEERSRIEVDCGHLLILINIPVVADSGSSSLLYDTMPLGIIVSADFIVTVCLKDNPIIDEMEYSKDRSFHTFKHTRFVLQILFKTAYYYLRYLKHIDRKSSEIESLLHKSMKNEELLKLLDLEKSLVFFTTSIKANEIVMEKLLRNLRANRVNDDPDLVVTSQVLQMYPDDEDLLEDVITENKQAMEMCQTYTDILSGMMDAFASIISNNLNIVMKFLASITILLAIPSLVSGFFGMNVTLPFQKSPYGFILTIAISVLLSVIGYIFLKRKNMF